MPPRADDGARYVGSSDQVRPSEVTVEVEDAGPRCCAVCGATPAPRTRASAASAPGAAVVARARLDLCRTCDGLVDAGDRAGLVVRSTGRSDAEVAALLHALVPIAG